MFLGENFPRDQPQYSLIFRDSLCPLLGIGGFELVSSLVCDLPDARAAFDSVRRSLFFAFVDWSGLGKEPEDGGQPSGIGRLRELEATSESRRMHHERFFREAEANVDPEFAGWSRLDAGVAKELFG